MNTRKRISALFTDFYELSMMQAYWKSKKNPQAVFDVFFRRPPFDENGYILFAGLDVLLEDLEHFRFDENELAYLASLHFFDPLFLEELRNFRFTAHVSSVAEGSLVFAHEAIMRFEGSLFELQVIEGLVLNTINFQSLIASKASRMVYAAKQFRHSSLVEFGLRRAQGYDGALSASRAAYIGGATASSNTLAGAIYGIPLRGTMAHSWVMSFQTEKEAFENYAEIYPQNCILLVDTYDTLKKGIPAAIPVLQKLQAKGCKNFGIRLDSGDLDSLSKKARQVLDAAGLEKALIVASNDLDENLIAQLAAGKSPIDIWGVGTRLVTGDQGAYLSGVYKMASIQIHDQWHDKVKISNHLSKQNLPGRKNILRLYNEKGLMVGDIIILEEECSLFDKLLPQREAFTVFPYPGMDIPELCPKYAKGEVLLHTVMSRGKKTQEKTLDEIRHYAQESFDHLHESYYRLLKAGTYKIFLSERLHELMKTLVLGL